MSCAVLPAGVGATHVSDALDALGVAGRVVLEPLRAVGPNAVVVGRAFPMRVAAAVPDAGDRSSGLIAAMDSVPRDTVVLIEAADCSFAMLGELTFATVVGRGTRGVLCNGYVRDVEALRAGPVGVHARGTTPLRSYGRADVVEFGRPTRFAGIPVAPGDLVVADADGIVIVPEAAANAVAERAAQIAAAESRIRAGIRAGRSLLDAIGSA